MKAVVLSGFGGVDVLGFGEVPDPALRDDELLVRVRATALNRADLIQRRGKYPPPPGATEVLGLEMAGEVIRAGPGCTDTWREGDRLCALLPGGGCAERATIPEGMAMRLPESLSFEEGAAIPEAFLTAHHNLFRLGGLGPGKTVLLHAGGSGVGTAAIQLIREAGATALVTAGSPEKVARCRALGALAGWNYKEGPFAPWVAGRTGGQGVDLILDFVGAPYLEQNLSSLAADGRLILLAVMGGAQAERVNLALLLTRRAQVIGSTLRSLPVERKVEISRSFWSYARPLFAEGRLRPVIDSVRDWTDIAKAHERMESNLNFGKIVLRVS